MLKFATLDVFTDRRFAGNPLAIVEAADALTGAQMQTITREFNLSETVFLLKPEQAENQARARIFFPGGEMSFAGHPIIGTAIFLATGLNPGEGDFSTLIRLEVPAGLVPIIVERRNGAMMATLTAPVLPAITEAVAPTPDTAARALDLAENDIGLDAHRCCFIAGGPTFLFIPLQSRAALAQARPREPFCSALFPAEAASLAAAYVYTRGEAGSDTHFHARMFSPAGGIPEDPATGSATVLLAAQLLQADHLADGAHRFQLQQGYDMGRPSDLTLEVDVAQGKLALVRLSGSAVAVMRGEIETA